ncbi:MAG: CoA pyrophosphatase [Candidatus Lokiarchaeota archaeon]|nr:CoA pyrophosphatase [Candidatus Lokiarchaeota archaeon]
MEFMNLFFNEDLFKNKLKKFNSPLRISFRDNCLISSAILFLIIPNDKKPYNLVLIQRAHRSNDKYSGEMSFPGGLYNPQLDDTYKDTALRETEEELGIPRDKIQIIGCIDDVITPKRHVISPFVGYTDKHQKMIKCDDEVEEIIKIPISFFVDKKNYIERTYKLRGESIAVGKYTYKTNNKKYVIFGATSHMIVNFIELIYNLKFIKSGARRIILEDLKSRYSKTS